MSFSEDMRLSWRLYAMLLGREGVQLPEIQMFWELTSEARLEIVRTLGVLQPEELALTEYIRYLFSFDRIAQGGLTDAFLDLVRSRSASTVLPLR